MEDRLPEWRLCPVCNGSRVEWAAKASFCRETLDWFGDDIRLSEDGQKVEIRCTGCGGAGEAPEDSPLFQPPPAWWTEAKKPSRQRNMTQSERGSLAKSFRRLRVSLAAPSTEACSPFYIDLDAE